MHLNQYFMQSILIKLTELEKLVLELKSPPSGDRQIFDIDGAAWYTYQSKSTVYKQCAAGEIPHYKPNGRIYFKRSELDEWMLTNKQNTRTQISQRTDNFFQNRKIQ